MFIHRLRYLLLAISLFGSVPAFACESGQSCIEKGQWDIGIAFGIGARSNPLVDGNTFPNIILIDVAWYGDQIYFDNGELGFRLIENQKTGFETYLVIDREAAYFDLLHPGNFSISSLISPTTGQPIPPDNQTLDSEEVRLSLDDIRDRKWAVNLGGRYHYYTEKGEVSFSYETDVSSVHQGSKAALSYEHYWSGDDWQLSIRPSVLWKSDKLVNYYYGVSAQDFPDNDIRYTAKGGLQPSLSLTYTKRFSEDWYWVANLSYQKLHSSMVASPIVDENNVSSVFLGLGYRF
ncbi:MipA/OmpV family protein [Aliiglaciecola sp.]|nr:MipA/OmpV family protein [Aliiglaciecola sp.]